MGNDSFVEDDQGDVGAVLCDCGTHVCPNCETADHPGLSYTQNKAIHAGNDEPFLQIASQKAISECLIPVEFTHGCNHMSLLMGAITCDAQTATMTYATCVCASGILLEDSALPAHVSFGTSC